MTNAFRPDVEGLRGVAILLVVGYHVGLPGLGGGFVGVDIFFVLSGYLITGLLLTEIERTGRINCVEFYGRRARRLLPLALLVGLVTMAAAAIVFSPLEQRNFSLAALATTGYLGNVWFMRLAIDYFSGVAPNDPFLHMWSLGVEEQFYLVWPALLLLMSGRHYSARRTLIVIAVLSALSFAGSVWLTGSRQPWAFFGSPARFWEFGVGGLVCFVSRSWLAGNRTLAGTLGWLGALMIGGSVGLLSPAFSFPGVWVLPTVLGTAAVLTAGAVGDGAGPGVILSHPMLRRIGQLSYGWYLWHWPALAIAVAIVPSLGVVGGMIAVGSALILAMLTHPWPENAFRYAPALIARPGRTLALAGLATAMVLVTAWTWHLFSLRMANSTAHRTFYVASSELPTVSGAECMAQVEEREPRECHFGTVEGARTVVLFGDSHAAQWFPALDRIAREQGWRLATFLKTSCPIADVPVFSVRFKRDYAECRAWRDAARLRIIELRPELVIVSHYSMAAPETRDWKGEYEWSAPAEWRAGVRRTLSVLDGAGIRTLLLRDTPHPRFDVPVCLSRRAYSTWRAGSSCDASRAEALDDVAVLEERRAGDGLQSVSFLDLSDQICAAETCPAIRNGTVVYRDGNHLSVSFVESLTPELENRLAPFMP